MATGTCLTLREFAREIGNEITRYHTATFHRGIKTTPLLKAAGCHLERERLDLEFVARALMRREKKATIHGNGIEFLGVWYFHHALIGHVGEPAEIGYLDQHPEYIEVFHPDHTTGEMEWLCRATPAAEATKAMAGRVYTARTHALESLRSAESAAKRIAAEELAALRANSPAVDEAEADQPASRRRPRRTDQSVRQAAEERLNELTKEGVFTDAQA